MKTRLSSCFVVVIAFLRIFPSVTLGQQTPQLSRLASVKTIYIGDLGSEEGAALVREKIRFALLKSGRFKVVEKRETADAILSGAAGVERRYSSGLFHLIDIRSDETIWTFEYKRGFWSGSASSRVANKTVEQLLKDADSSARRANGRPHK